MPSNPMTANAAASAFEGRREEVIGGLVEKTVIAAACQQLSPFSHGVANLGMNFIELLLVIPPSKEF